jgi:hypothetical protein
MFGMADRSRVGNRSDQSVRVIIVDHLAVGIGIHPTLESPHRFYVGMAIDPTLESTSIQNVRIIVNSPTCIGHTSDVGMAIDPT